MTWATARAELVSILNGAQVSVTLSGQAVTDTLTALEYPPRARQGPDTLPLAFVIPPARRVTRGANSVRIVEIEGVKVRVLLHDSDAEYAAQRMEAWVGKLSDLIGNNIALNGQLQGAIESQEFSEFSLFGPQGGPPYGFEMVLGLPVAIVETETRGA